MSKQATGQIKNQKAADWRLRTVSVALGLHPLLILIKLWEISGFLGT